MKKIRKVNYDLLSAAYNLRYRNSPMTGISDELRRIVITSKSKNVLEVGCGTGYWLNCLKTENINLFGIDLSRGMLGKINNDELKLNLICADANSLPFIYGQFDLIFCVNAIHQFRDKKEFIKSAARLLKPEGILAVVGLNPGHKDHKWYIYDYFEGVYQTDLKRFPSFTDIKTWMKDSGLKNVRLKTAHKIRSDKKGKEVFNDSFLLKDQSSQLASLSEEEYSAGIEKIRKAVENNPKKLFPVRMNFVLIKGNKI